MTNKLSHKNFQSKFFERVWENFCSQKFSQLPPPLPSSSPPLSSPLFSPSLFFMSYAFDLAKWGGNRVYPNPLVGALVVKNNKILGLGWHEYFGAPHAEVNALNAAGKKAFGADLYVTLEPCSSFGKTPPCVDSIIAAKIRQVFIGAVDANPQNSNRALSLLKKHGIEVQFLDFQRQHEELNKVFLHALKNTLPYVQLKAGISLDGKLQDSFGKSQWITGEKSGQKVQQLRQSVDGILIGANTFNRDNPQLSLRPRFDFLKEPAKIIVSASGRLNPRHTLLCKENEAPVILCTTREGQAYLQSKVKNSKVQFLIFSRKKKKLSVKNILKKLKTLGYYNILIEGGGDLFACFLKQKTLFQELHLFLAPKVFGGLAKTWTGHSVLDGVDRSPAFDLNAMEKLDNDVYLRFSCSLVSSKT